MVYVDKVQGIYEGKSKVEQKEKRKFYVGFLTQYIANFEAFRRNILLRANFS